LNGSSDADDRADDGGLGMREGQEHFVGPPPRKDLRQVLARAEHRHAMNAVSHLGRVVVHETNRLVAVGRVVLHVADDQLAGVARAEDQDALLRLCARQLRRQRRLIRTPPRSSVSSSASTMKIERGYMAGPSGDCTNRKNSSELAQTPPAIARRS
jgi:hypothetical protein